MGADGQLRTAVLNELEWDPTVDASHIGVVVNDGAVTLSGHVLSSLHKAAAVVAAERVPGVRAVADLVEVENAVGPRYSDSELAEEIARVRIPAPVVAEVRSRKVTLRGTVETSEQRTAAEAAVRRLDGVRAVHNEILVAADAKVDAAEIERRVEVVLERAADLEAQSIVITTNGGTVRLQGRVRSIAERRLAERAAASTPGVTVVENELVVAD